MGPKEGGTNGFKDKLYATDVNKAVNAPSRGAQMWGKAIWRRRRALQDLVNLIPDSITIIMNLDSLSQKWEEGSRRPINSHPRDIPESLSTCV